MRRYSLPLIALHWLTAVTILVCWFVAEGGPRVRSNVPLLHMTLGLSVLVLVAARLIARFADGRPQPDAATPPLLAMAAKAGHGLLYALMIALPLTGWYTASRLGIPVSFFGFGLPALTMPVIGPPGLIGELHENGGTFILILAGLHGVAALWHQFVRHDGTLARMSPFTPR